MTRQAGSVLGRLAPRGPGHPVRPGGAELTTRLLSAAAAAVDAQPGGGGGDAGQAAPPPPAAGGCVAVAAHRGAPLGAAAPGKQARVVAVDLQVCSQTCTLVVKARPVPTQAVSHLQVRNVLQLYVDVEHTGRNAEFIEKFEQRERMGELLSVPPASQFWHLLYCA